MEVKFEVTTQIIVNSAGGKAKLKHVNLGLEVSKNLNRKAYFGNDEMPNKAGSQAMTSTLIQGLIGNIHSSHQKGFRDSAEHLRYIISELERGFIEIVNVTEGEFDSL